MEAFGQESYCDIIQINVKKHPPKTNVGFLIPSMGTVVDKCGVRATAGIANQKVRDYREHVLRRVTADIRTLAECELAFYGREEDLDLCSAGQLCKMADWMP
ncbi:hypothetical protein SK128_011398 [Halocaridina rubra]|uniref:Uncharacterized protein n=1 Tax=Halocaridina rubra TaxID=373956 RepID=A0AAN8WYS7_HALRR